MRDEPWTPDEERIERERKKREKQARVRQNRKERIWEKVEQQLRDLWRPYHGSTAHREDSDGNQMVEKKKSGGHMPLNAAVMALSNEGKLKDSREMLARELYRLSAGSHLEVVCFAEIRDLFGRYGAGDSDLEQLRKKAVAHGPASESAAKVRAVETGIDLVVERLIEAGVKNKDFWAAFGLAGVPTKRTQTAEEKDQERYLMFLEESEKLRQKKRDEYVERGKTPPANIRVKTRAMEKTAYRRGEARSTIQAAVEKHESGYIRDEAS